MLIDSEQLESGEALDDNFRSMASDEIDRFRREIVERGGKLAEELQGGKELDDVTLLREVMNTVGKYGQLGGSIRCVVSVAMLTEGWDANTVTHVLGVRAFGTQLLCEQVIGRALRRQSPERKPVGERKNSVGRRQSAFLLELPERIKAPLLVTSRSRQMPYQGLILELHLAAFCAVLKRGYREVVWRSRRLVNDQDAGTAGLFQQDTRLPTSGNIVMVNRGYIR